MEPAFGGFFFARVFSLMCAVVRLSAGDKLMPVSAAIAIIAVVMMVMVMLIFIHLP